MGQTQLQPTSLTNLVGGVGGVGCTTTLGSTGQVDQSTVGATYQTQSLTAWEGTFDNQTTTTLTVVVSSELWQNVTQVNATGLTSVGV